MSCLSHIITIYSIVWLSTQAFAQFPPRPTDFITVNSSISKGAQVRYKKVNLCETTRDVKSFSGYIDLPANTLRQVGLDQERPIHTFFWFFESRKTPEKSPLTLYLNGGPGAPSTLSLLRENGPCYVNNDGKTTRLNAWSWNTESNILFIDQPVNTGFSYDVPANGTVDFGGVPASHDFQHAPIAQNDRMAKAGTIGLGSLDGLSAVNSTEAAVRAIWLSLSIWLQDFPEFRNQDRQLGLWAASYGGHWAPALYDFTMAQNRDIGTHRSLISSAPKIRFSSIGLANACVDSLVQLPANLEIAYINTYGLQLIDQATYTAGWDAWTRPNGCKSRIEACRRTVGISPYLGDSESINAICRDANAFCGKNIANIISPSGRSFFNFGHHSNYLNDPSLYTYLAYLQQAEIQQALGVPVNFTDQGISNAHAFQHTADNIRGDYVASLGRALEDGVRVSLMYGDRDYACNWLGGEDLSLAISYDGAHQFRASGYEPLASLNHDDKSNRSPGAYVRQYGNLSFVRVLDSGHTINTDKPSIGFDIYNRTISGTDIASGHIKLSDAVNYSTTGPASTKHIRNQLPADWDQREGMCYTLALAFCSYRQVIAYLRGGARVRDYWLVEYGDGTCSPNPVEPCELNGIGKTDKVVEQAMWIFSGRLEGGGWNFVGWVVLIVMAVAGVFWISLPWAVAYMRGAYEKNFKMGETL